ncbi:ATP-binding protein [Lutibaculum baratangense]|uniref:YhaN AAA domain-containing protein n=1 Tax=Lutibaculum baratangense AMV1 TaxID=631454 RepID=V4T7K3_9HYPH|nr:YhaN family protein [Lutibaculum baratangense]ESR22598.1 hypothetical protein N177_3734 [Lutibaculum baratangense AMV1]
MRFERLHLLRYGALSDRTLGFRPDARLHLVYGPNEAGKTSALAAISDLLFGFPHLKAYDFVHDAASLRVAATLEARDGSVLSFRRRRGNKSTLLADDDNEAALRDDALAPFLGSLTREVFERAFGLDSQRLRRGADEMLRSDGELGSMLFAASSGLSGLSGLKSDLDAEAGQIFAPRASKDRLFYQALARHEEARRAERESELSATRWKALNQEIDDLRLQYDELADAKARLRTRVSRLETLRTLQPIVAEIDGDEARLAEYGDLAGLPAGFASDLEGRLDEAERAQRAFAAAEEQVARCREQLGRIVVDRALLQEAEAVSALFGRSGDYAGKARDIPRIVAERDDYEAQLVQISRRLGVGRDELEARLPSDAAIARAQALVAEGRRLAEDRASMKRRLQEERETLARLDDEKPTEALVDPRPWRDRLLALGPDLRLVEGRAEREASIRGERRRIAEDAARLEPAVVELDRLAQAAMPSLETMARQHEDIAALDRKLEALRARQAEAEERLARLRSAIAETERSGVVPTDAAIREAREARDAGFATLADALLGRRPLAAEGAHGEIERFGALVREADRLADAALSDAERVVTHAARLSEVEALAEAGRGLDEEAASLEARREALLDAFAGPLRRLGLEPGGTEPMLGWRRSLDALLEDRRRLLAEEDAVAGLAALEDRMRPALEEIAAAVGLAAGSLPVPAMARAAEDRLRHLGEAWTESRTQAGRREDCLRRIAKLEADGEALAGDEEGWRRRFAEGAGAIGLAASAGADEASVALGLWEKVPAILRERDNRARRVAGMERDIDAFTAAAGDFVARLAPDLAGLPPLHQVERLNERAQAARTAMAQERDARASLQEGEVALQARSQEVEAARAARDALLDACPQGADPADLVRRLRERDGLREELRKCRTRLAEVAAGAAETEVREDLTDFDRERAGIEIETLKKEEARLDGEMNEVFAALSERRRERERLDASGGAERAAFEKNAAEVEAVEAARRWAVLRLASGLLSAAIERHRDRQSDPVMRRAGELFSILTGGSFAALRQEYDKDDQPQLVGVRPSGERVDVAGLSDGTRDQLYLALRLAFLEDYATRNEPAPFIGDDIFQTFDDDRTAAGLRTLAAASGSFQPILFAHHRSVVDIARDVLGTDADIIEL